MKHFPLLLLFFALGSFTLLSGCTETSTIPGLPFTASQFFSKVTDLNYTEFLAGTYDGNFVVVDGNKLSIAKIDINSYNIDWNKLINFPSGCGANQAVKIVGSSLVCIDLPLDTNTQTAGWTDSSGKWLQDFTINAGHKLSVNNIYDATGTHVMLGLTGNQLNLTYAGAVKDADLKDSVKFGYRQLMSYNETMSLDWENKDLNGNWTRNNNVICDASGNCGSSIDTNTQTAGWTDINGVWNGIDLNVSEKNIYANKNLVVGTNTLFANSTTSNVGIGTTAPAYKLDVNGGIIFRKGSASEGAGAYYNNGSTWYWGTDGSSDVMRLYSATRTNNPISVNGTTGITTFTGVNFPQLRMTNVAPESVPVAYPNNSEAVSISYNNTLQMRFGGGNSGAYPAWIQVGKTDGTSTYPLLLNPLGGNIGIGTTNPGAPLDFAASLGSKISLYQNSGYGIGVQDGIIQIYAGSTNVNRIGLGYGTSVSFNEVMSVLGSGKVGIGTTTPANKLNVIGDANITTITTLNDLNVSGNIRVGGTASIADGNRWVINSVDLIALTSTRCYISYKKGIVIDSNCATS